MIIEHIQNIACYLQRFITFFSGRSGPGPSGPVRKILVVRSGPEGPQFSRSFGTLVSGGSPNDFCRDNIAGSHGT